MFFNEDHLRITKPISINGMTPKIVDGKVVNRIIHLPLGAESGLREENNRLPDGLKMKIEKMPGYTPPPQPSESDSLKIQLAELMAANAKLQKELTEKKVGRPKKETA
jgi:hypothetical protein